jgi:hypothetical protein
MIAQWGRGGGGIFKRPFLKGRKSPLRLADIFIGYRNIKTK